jgi:hypothetical protein
MMPPASGNPLSTSSRMVIAAVCQPLAANPANSVLFAVSLSRWKGCGSNWPANALIWAASMT